ncbi:hypothetical protein Tco_1303925 [Tanacetum coccineum]
MSWEDICLPKREGGLGIRCLKVFNIALMSTHIWNIVSNKESLWVRWIHMYKLKGCILWDIRPKTSMSWGWRKLLQLRDVVKPFLWKQVGNGLQTSLWYDTWYDQSPLANFLTPRDITRNRFHLRMCVADIITNRAWNWPQAWLLKAPNLGLIPVLVLNDTEDCIRWRDGNGNSHPRHLAGMERVAPILEDIIAWLLPIGAKRSFNSVVGKLLFAAATYFIWSERNNHLFKNQRRTSEDIRDLVMVTVRLKSPLKADDWIDMILILLHDDRVQYCYNYCWLDGTRPRQISIFLEWDMNVVMIRIFISAAKLILLEAVTTASIGFKRLILLALSDVGQQTRLDIG